RDAIGRRWQTSTIQVDFFLPGRFELEYTTAENTAGRPVMVHCAKAGSIERFIGVLTEHYAGAFPTWLAPVQATVVPVADRHLDYAGQVAGELRSAGLRVEVDDSGETVGEKIRRAITAKHPAVLVVGDRDVEAGTVGLRRYGDDSERRGVPHGEVTAELGKEAEAPSGAKDERSPETAATSTEPWPMTWPSRRASTRTSSGLTGSLIPSGAGSR